MESRTIVMPPACFESKPLSPQALVCVSVCLAIRRVAPPSPQPKLELLETQPASTFLCITTLTLTEGDWGDEEQQTDHAARPHTHTHTTWPLRSKTLPFLCLHMSAHACVAEWSKWEGR